MQKNEAIEILKEFLEDCDKMQKTENKTPLRKAFDLAYKELCKSKDKDYFKSEEVNKICSAIINSPVDTSRELQDKVYRVLSNYTLPF